MDDRERGCWIAFNRAPGVGVVRFRRLLSHFGTLAAAWAAPRRELALAGLDKRALDALDTLRPRLDPSRELARVRQVGAQVLTWLDAGYPALLQAIPDPPPVLYLRGRLDPADGQALAIVGTRRPTVYGRDVAERLAFDLAAAGLTIVSGLAKGIDTHAHRGALAAGGRTLAVLGHGIETCYPPENRRLAAAIAEQGAVLTDYPLGTGPAGENFPPRNRIISGLAAGVLVVEAGAASGALITSRFAADQGRDVFAVPGPITSDASRGCHKLIQDGAKLAACAEDILEELNPHLGSLATVAQQLQLDLPAPSVPVSVRTAPGQGEIDSWLVERLGEAGQPVHVDQLARLGGRPVHEISGALTLLELQGRVRHLGSMRYALAR
jgi:DNA processing protein